MKMLVNGSKNAIDILTKKAQLFELLKTYAIKEEEAEDAYKKENYKYNIEESAIIKKYSEGSEEKYILDILKKLNFISIKRAEREKNNFERIGYILLTENSKINMIAWDEEIKHKGDVPLATNLQFITNKLWFKLNKGFGDGDYPASFKVVTKAQTLLASHLSDTLTKEYYELQTRVKNGKMTSDIALIVLFELRNRSKMPEELFDADMPSVLETITEKKLDDYALQHEKTTKKNKKLEQELENSRAEENKIQQEKEEVLRDKTKLEEIIELNKEKQKLEKNKLLKELLGEKEKNYFQFKAEKELIDRKAEKIFKKEYFFGILAYICIVMYIACYYINWNNFEKWAWIVMTFFVPLAIHFMKKYFKKVQDYISARKAKLLNTLYLKNKISIKEIEKLSKDISDLKNELKQVDKLEK